MGTVVVSVFPVVSKPFGGVLVGRFSFLPNHAKNPVKLQKRRFNNDALRIKLPNNHDKKNQAFF